MEKFNASLILDSLCMTNFSPNSEAFMSFSLSIVFWKFTVITRVWTSFPSCAGCMEVPFNQKIYIPHCENFYCFFDHFLPFIFCVLIFLSLLFSVFLTFLPYFFKISSIISSNPSIDFVFNFGYLMFNFLLSFLVPWLFLFKQPISWIQCLLIPLGILMIPCLFGLVFHFLFCSLNCFLWVPFYLLYVLVFIFHVGSFCANVWWSLDFASI